ncbi:hypothetical protein [Acaryochloris marina]|uniref:hypothetical protein n=1 Tax=Acaryochloris marina TaxID=155978 RepID=UPI001EE658BB|nr:hypothetical protein [Acaryochloris marina]
MSVGRILEVGHFLDNLPTLGIEHCKAGSDMGGPKQFSETADSDEISRLRKQLTISIKFHQYKHLQKLPLEVAVRAMAEAWEACYPESVPPHCSGTSTAILSNDQVAKSIRESKYFSGA